MTNFDQVWGPTPNNAWREVSQTTSSLLAILPVISWVGMIAFGFFSALAMLDYTSTVLPLLAGLGLIVWLTSAVIYIRMRRAQRKFLTVQDE
jgi:hypothetical protein